MDWSGTFSDVLSTYRDVEVAKRSQPRLVQGIQQVQAPVQRNADASVSSGPGASVGAGASGYKLALMVGGGLLVTGLAFVALRRKR